MNKSGPTGAIIGLGAVRAFVGGGNNDAGATHHIDYGFSEHRSTSFNAGAYESAHPDLIGKYASNDAGPISIPTKRPRHFDIASFGHGRRPAGLMLSGYLSHVLSSGILEIELISAGAFRPCAPAALGRVSAPLEIE
jgi:hypothetical protein